MRSVEVRGEGMEFGCLDSSFSIFQSPIRIALSILFLLLSNQLIIGFELPDSLPLFVEILFPSLVFVEYTAPSSLSSYICNVHTHGYIYVHRNLFFCRNS